jgi:dTDP-4-amino-4,6-dideoxygalactose transaminase
MPRQKFVEALNAEGIPAVAGYVVPLYKQPLFAQKNFGPYTGYKLNHPNLDYGNLNLPNCEAICGGEGGWLLQNLMLGSRQDMDDVVAAFRKVYDNRGELRAGTREAVGAAR